MTKAEFFALRETERMITFFRMTPAEQRQVYAWIDEANKPQTATVEVVPTTGYMIPVGARVLVKLYDGRRSDSVEREGQVTVGGRKCDDVGVWDTVHVLFGDPLDPDNFWGPYPYSARDVTPLDGAIPLGTVEKPSDIRQDRPVPLHK